MKTTLKKQEPKELRKKFSIELCQSFISRLDPSQSQDIKINAIIAIKNYINESKIADPILYSFLVDSIVDPDKKIRDFVIRVIKEVANPEIIELLEIKEKEINGEFKEEIRKILQKTHSSSKNQSATILSKTSG